MKAFSRWLPLAVLALGAQAEAHVKWFHQGERPPFDVSALGNPLTLLLMAVVVVAVAGLWVLQRARGGRGLLPSVEWFGATPERRMGLYGFVPAILAVHLAVTLFVSSVTGHLFSPDNALPGASAYLLGLAQTGIALSLFYGGLARVAAVGLAGLWLSGVILLGLEPMLDNALILGFAAFFFLAGRGPIAIDRLILPRLEPNADLMRHAMTALRVGVGLSLTVAALTEKLGNPALAQRFLGQFPLNFTASLGIPIPDDVFIRLAGSVELLVGLCLIFGVMVREIIVIAWVPINLTLTVFDWTELVGHLPIYGAMAVLLVWEPGVRNLELWVRGLREGPLPVPKNVDA